jgi:hypothetical protein
MYRAWINQPSTAQPDHHLHGFNVLVDASESQFSASVKVYFLSGSVVSQECLRLSLSLGWKS